MFQHFNIDRRKSIPLENQIELEIRRLLYLNSQLKIPTVHEIAHFYHLLEKDIQTIYDKLSEEKILEKEGLNYKAHANLKVSFQAESKLPVYDAIAQSGLKPKIIELERKVVTRLPKTDFTPLQDTNDSYLYFKRIYQADARAIQLIDAYYPLNHWKNISDIDFTEKPIMNILENLYQNISNRSSYIRSTSMDQTLADLFNLPIGTPIFYVVNKRFNEQGQLIEFAITHSMIQVTQKLEFE